MTWLDTLDYHGINENMPKLETNILSIAQIHSLRELRKREIRDLLEQDRVQCQQNSISAKRKRSK